MTIEIVDLPINSMVICHSNVSSPEGKWRFRAGKINYKWLGFSSKPRLIAGGKDWFNRGFDLEGAARKIDKLVNITLITRTYGRYIYIVNGLINHMITGGTTLWGPAMVYVGMVTKNGDLTIKLISGSRPTWKKMWKSIVVHDSWWNWT